MDEPGGRRILMPGVIDEAERAEPPGEPEPGLVPVEDPGDVADPGPADRQAPEGDEIGGAAQAAPPGCTWRPCPRRRSRRRSPERPAGCRGTGSPRCSRWRPAASAAPRCTSSRPA
ncbi:hypothetical protein [Actinomadura sp.]|jgi:hypothetical protein|uniref:hypothetical protein n=1 Tax=Actinomadura sp. TaxID=1989 RepID=UPI00336499BA